MKGKLEFTVTEQTLLLPFLLERLSNKSRNFVKGVLKRGQVSISGRPCTEHARALSPGTVVEVTLAASPQTFKMALPVIYEDAEILVIDKPAGMLSISTDREKSATAYHIVTDYVKSRDPSSRVFIVHRLDRETSGIMLFAKNEQLKGALQDNWDKLVSRRGYLAVVEGQVADEKGTITSWLKQTKTLLVYSSERNGEGKKATTHYERRVVSDHYSLLDVSLDTGRKNQIRVHMQDLGHPVAGDKKYGAKTNPLGRLGLHAHALTVTHPITGKELSFTSKMPSIFQKAL